MRDASAKERMARGERGHHAKLTEELVREIRALYKKGGLSMRELGRRYGLIHPSISAIIHRRSWKHVT